MIPLANCRALLDLVRRCPWPLAGVSSFATLALLRVPTLMIFDE